MSDESWLPRFEKREDDTIVHYAGQKWRMTRGICTSFPPQHWGDLQHRARLDIEMVLLPPDLPDLSIPDNIILGDN